MPAMYKLFLTLKSPSAAQPHAHGWQGLTFDTVAEQFHESKAHPV